MMENLLRFDRDSIFFFYDVETFNLCLSRHHNAPWQIAYIKFRGDGKIIEKKNILIWWGDQYTMSAGAAVITRYNAEYVKANGVTPEEGYRLFKNGIKGAKYVGGHNIFNFDNPLTRELGIFLEGKPYPFEDHILLDTFSLAKGLMTEFLYKKDIGFTPYQIKMSGFKSKVRGLSLSVLARNAGIQIDEMKLHDATYDLEINVQYLHKLKQQIEI